jgi:NADPH:quinone reductase-like Zn-dependent oxidoreductase
MRRLAPLLLLVLLGAAQADPRIDPPCSTLTGTDTHFLPARSSIRTFGGSNPNKLDSPWLPAICTEKNLVVSFAVPGVNVIPKPENLSWPEAAALPLVTLTAWHMLVTQARIQPGEDVLVHAAGSGVGSLGIQIAKLFGARVIATASSEDKPARARELGADETVNYAREDWPKEVRRLTNRKGVDIVFEHTGAATWPGSIISLRKGGRLVTCGATSGFDARTDLRQVFYRHLTILGSMMGSKAELLAAMKFIESGQIRAVIDRTLPLSEARKAHELMEDRAQFGKLVLVI